MNIHPSGVYRMKMKYSRMETAVLATVFTKMAPKAGQLALRKKSPRENTTRAWKK